MRQQQLRSRRFALSLPDLFSFIAAERYMAIFDILFSIRRSLAAGHHYFYLRRLDERHARATRRHHHFSASGSTPRKSSHRLASGLAADIIAPPCDYCAAPPARSPEKYARYDVFVAAEDTIRASPFWHACEEMMR